MNKYSLKQPYSHRINIWNNNRLESWCCSKEVKRPGCSDSPSCEKSAWRFCCSLQELLLLHTNRAERLCRFPNVSWWQRGRFLTVQPHTQTRSHQAAQIFNPRFTGGHDTANWRLCKCMNNIEVHVVRSGVFSYIQKPFIHSFFTPAGCNLNKMCTGGVWINGSIFTV